MSIKALQEYTRFSKYARYLPEKSRRETWNEQVSRVFSMHRERFNYCLEELTPYLESAEKALLKREILGSQRALQFGGQPILDKNTRLYNCTVSYCDRPRFFQEFMYVLLCGCGAGFSVQKHHIQHLPEIKPVDKSNPRTYQIPDSIEGWSDCIGEIVGSYFQGSQEVNFDYSLIRPAGSPISSGGKAPGPSGLKNSIEKIRQILDKATKNGPRQLRPIECYDICMHISDSVLSGGIRRSATICLFSPSDREMREAKIGSWFHDNPQRARSNNSALLVRDETTREEFRELMQSVKEFGEPGFVWTEHRDIIYNPCLSKNTWVTTKEYGPQQIKDLLDKGRVHILIDGVFQPTTEKGFWQTGTEEVNTLVLENGMEIECTGNHQFLTKEGKWVEYDDLARGDYIQLSDNHLAKWDGSGTKEQGWLIGNLIGDGCISENECRWTYWGVDRLQMHKNCKLFLESVLPDAKINRDYKFTENPSEYKDRVSIYSSRFKQILENYNITTTDDKTFNSSLERGSSDFYEGLIGGLFDADGSIWGGRKQGLYVSIAQNNKQCLQIVQRMLGRLGIESSIIKSYDAGWKVLPDGNGGEKEYYCTAGYEIRICGRYMVSRFFDRIYINSTEKLHKYYSLINEYTKAPYISKNLFYSKITNKVSKAVIQDVYDCTVPTTSSFDANGIIAHNCVEIGMYAYDEDGNSGWQFCNLCEINMRKAISEEVFLEQCRNAGILGTFQAAYTDFSYLGPITEKIVRREALLGVSMTGMMDNPDVAFDPKIQRKGAKEVLKVNEEVAKILGINICARATCVKPSGNSSCLLGTSSGVHPHHATRYFRHVQENKNEPALHYFMKYNPHACEESIWSTNKTDMVIKFLCEVPSGAKTKNQVDALTLLEHVKSTQQNWVEAGTRIEKCVLPILRHNVSNTINVKPHEWHDVENYIYRNRKYFAGISLLPMSGDKDYAQAPFTAVYTPQEIVKEYGDAAIFASGLVVDGLRCFDDDLWKACDTIMGIGNIPLEVYETRWRDYIIRGDQCDRFRYDSEFVGKIELTGMLFHARRDWLRRAKQFAERYFDGDIRQMTYCLKDVRNWKVWCDLKRDYQDVPWDEFMEGVDNTKQMEIVACAGGQCELA